MADFGGAGEQILRLAAVMADVGDPARSLPVDNRLVGAAILQIVEADERHVGALLCRTWERDQERGDDRELKTHRAK